MAYRRPKINACSLIGPSCLHEKDTASIGALLLTNICMGLFGSQKCLQDLILTNLIWKVEL